MPGRELTRSECLRILGLHETASAVEVRRAYRRLAIRLHPDRNPGDAAAQQRFIEVATAYAELRKLGVEPCSVSPRAPAVTPDQVAASVMDHRLMVAAPARAGPGLVTLVVACVGWILVGLASVCLVALGIGSVSISLSEGPDNPGATDLYTDNQGWLFETASGMLLVGACLVILSNAAGRGLSTIQRSVRSGRMHLRTPRSVWRSWRATAACVLVLLIAGAAWSAIRRHEQEGRRVRGVVASGSLRALQDLLGQGVDPNGWETDDDRSLLHLGAARGDARIVSALVSAGAEVNARDDRGQTPLHAACGAGTYAETAVVKCLLDAGADVNARDAQFQTPLHRVRWGGSDKTAALLLKYGADPTARDEAGRTPADVAVEYGAWVAASVLEGR